MTVEEIDIEEALANIKKLLKEEKNLSPALKAAIEIITFLVSVLVNRLGLNSRNMKQLNLKQDRFLILRSAGMSLNTKQRY